MTTKQLRARPALAPQTEQAWFIDYLDAYRRLLSPEPLAAQLSQLKQWMRETQQQKKKVILAGNGGSAAMASHCAVDFTKNAGIRCINFNEADLITCFANDFGYEWWLQRALEHYADAGDLVVLISSSGKSPNMLNAARYARETGLRLVTFTGFAGDNPLKTLGHLNFWVPSRAYNLIEMTHHVWLLAVCDSIIGCAEYPARKEDADAAERL